MKPLYFIIIMFWVVVGCGFAQEEISFDQDFVYEDGGRRDPFWPLVTAGGAVINYDERELSASDMTLQGIVRGEGGNVAIINGRIVKQGDMLGAFKIDRIESAFVVLDNGQERNELRLQKEE